MAAPDTVETLRERADALSRLVAAAHSASEALADELGRVGPLADAAEQRLAEARAKRPSFFGTMGQGLEGGFGLVGYLPWLIGAVIVAAVIADLCSSDEAAPPAFSAEGVGTVLSAADAELVARRCRLAMSPTERPGRCRAHVRCPETIFRGEVGCGLETHEVGDSEGSTTYTTLIVHDTTTAIPRLTLSEWMGEAKVVVGTQEPVDLALHELRWRGRP